MKIITAPDKGYGGNDVFLAGSIEQGKAIQWQTQVAVSLRDRDVTLYNPRRETWDATLEQDISNPVFSEQVNWELDHIERAKTVFFYFQAGTLSPISLLELGLVCERSKMWRVRIIVVCEPGFWRRGNIQVLCDRIGVPVLDTLEEGIARLLVELP